MKRAILIAAFILLTASFVCSQEPNEIPKYGGIKKTPELVQSDNEFIETLVKLFGSRDKAADDVIATGFAFLANGDWRSESHLDRFATQLKNEPTARGYIVVYGERTRGDDAKKYLVANGKIDPDRLVVIARKRLNKIVVRLYVVPTAASPPVR